MRAEVIPGAVAAAGAPSIDISKAIPAVPPKGEIMGFLQRLTDWTSYNAVQLAGIRDSWWSLKKASLLDTRDMIMLPMGSQADSLVNWVNNGQAATLTGGSWAAGVFSLDGVDDYLSTGVNPSVGSKAWKLNSAAISIDIRAIAQENPAGSADGNIPLQRSILGVGNSGGGSLNYLPFNGSSTPAGSAGMRMNASSTATVTSGSSALRTGHTLLNRTADTVVRCMVEGQLRTTSSQAAAVLPSGVIQVGRDGSNYSKFSFGAVTVGGALTEAQEAVLFRVVQNMRKLFGG